jgi:FkbM family methyltransferase
MLTKLKFVSRPEYMYRPSQLWRPLRYSLRRPSGPVQVMTPWGLSLIVNPAELHGRAMLTLGLIDLRVSEVLHRTIRQGDCAIDVGANVGAMTSLMARRSGTRGKVYAIEPHPESRSFLSQSAALWAASRLRCARVEILPLALSNASGPAFLEEPEGFAVNSGLARVSREAGLGTRAIETTTFDNLFGDLGKVRTVKVDVEGHEDEVLDGMRSALARRSIDFIVFEEFRPLPSPACITLEEFGYSTYLIDRNFWGVKLVPTHLAPEAIENEPTSVLAVHPGQDLSRLQQKGWRCLRPFRDSHT